MPPFGPDEFMERLLAAHGAEDAFEPDEEGPGEAVEAPTAASAIDPTPVLGLLTEAERVCGLSDVRLHAAAAA